VAGDALRVDPRAGEPRDGRVVVRTLPAAVVACDVREAVRVVVLRDVVRVGVARVVELLAARALVRDAAVVVRSEVRGCMVWPPRRIRAARPLLLVF
jgi:hypothetical protein